MNLEIPPELGATASIAWAWAVDFLPRLLGAALLVIGGVVAARYIARGVTGLADRTGRVDPTLKPVLRAIIRYGIFIIVLIAALGQLGVQTASILAALGAAGLAIGLALQGTLSNIAAGLMLLWLRPFRGGDYIETKDVAGTVEEVSLFNTRLRTWDGLYKFVPNSNLWNTTITNYSRNPTRLIKLDFAIAYENDITAARQLLIDLANRQPLVLKDPAAQVVPLSLADSAVVLQLRAWVPTSKFWDVNWELTETGKKAIEAAGFSIPFPQRVVHITTDAPVPPGMVLGRAEQGLSRQESPGAS